MAKKQQTTEEKDVLKDLEKKYGLERCSPKELEIVSTGSHQLNRAMKIGGTALGKIVEIYGAESSGKSTITLHQIAEYQRAFPERRVALCDHEHSFDPLYAKKIGVNVDNLLLYQPDTMEQSYNMIIGLIEKDIVSCVVIDSQTAAIPKAVLEGEMGDSTIGLQARLNSKFCLKVKGLLSIHKCTLFIISQTRTNIGGYGDGAVTTGGVAIKFYSDVRWKVWKQMDKEHESNKTTIDVIKSKIGVAYGQAKIDILWGFGFDKIGELIDLAIEFDIMKRGGAYYYYGETTIGQGLDKAKQTLDDNPELYDEIEEKILKALKNDDGDVNVEQLLIENVKEETN